MAQKLRNKPHGKPRQMNDFPGFIQEQIQEEGQRRNQQKDSFIPECAFNQIRSADSHAKHGQSVPEQQIQYHSESFSVIVLHRYPTP